MTPTSHQSSGLARADDLSRFRNASDHQIPGSVRSPNRVSTKHHPDRARPIRVYRVHCLDMDVWLRRVPRVATPTQQVTLAHHISDTNRQRASLEMGHQHPGTAHIHNHMVAHQAAETHERPWNELLHRPQHEPKQRTAGTMVSKAINRDLHHTISWSDNRLPEGGKRPRRPQRHQARPPPL